MWLSEEALNTLIHVPFIHVPLSDEEQKAMMRLCDVTEEDMNQTNDSRQPQMNLLSDQTRIFCPISRPVFC